MRHRRRSAGHRTRRCFTMVCILGEYLHRDEAYIAHPCQGYLAILMAIPLCSSGNTIHEPWVRDYMCMSEYDMGGYGDMRLCGVLVTCYRLACLMVD